MLTPQEVASRAFAKATIGGYNMAMVDEFLDALTEDYTTLYNDNAILKNKLKVLSDTVEEYRATDTAMRKTLLAAQQMAENMVNDAEKQKEAMVRDAEVQAQERLDGLRQEFADEELRLRKAKEATAAFVQEVRKAHEDTLRYLDHLDEISADVRPPEYVPLEEEPVRITLPDPVEPEGGQTEGPVPVGAEAAADPAQPDPEATRRFDDLQFGKDYEIK